MYISPPNFIRRIFPSLIWTMPETDRVYLTFDDGPTPGVTEWIVDQLARYDAKATFFCLGKNAEQHPHLFRMLVDGGHRIGNHTYSHQKGWRMSLERYLEDVDFANGLLQTDLFRPPYGRIKPSQAHRLSERYHIVMNHWGIFFKVHFQSGDLLCVRYFLRPLADPPSGYGGLRSFRKSPHLPS